MLVVCHKILQYIRNSLEKKEELYISAISNDKQDLEAAEDAELEEDIEFDISDQEEEPEKIQILEVEINQIRATSMQWRVDGIRPSINQAYLESVARDPTLPK